MENTVVFFRVFYPKPGLVKPKIAQEAGFNMASAIYHELIRYTFHHLEKIHEKSNIVIFYEPHRYKAEIEALFGEMDFKFLPMPQGDSEIDVIASCYKECFEMGYNKVIHSLVDDPILTFDLIDEASNQLTNNKSVIGPTEKNGIYLLGFNLEDYDTVLKEFKKLKHFDLVSIRKFSALLELNPMELETQLTIETMEDWEKFAESLQ